MTSMHRKRALFAFGLSGVILAALTACSGLGQPQRTTEPAEQYVPPEPPSGYNAKAIQYANQDMVSASNPLAVKAGVDM